MIDALFTQSLKNNDVTAIRALPSFVLNETEKEIVDFLSEYYDKHGKLPTVERFKKKGYSHYITSDLDGTPVSDLLDEVLAQKRKEHFLKTVSDIQISLDAGNDLRVADLSSLQREIDKTYIKGYETLSTFNAAHMYSTEKPQALLFGIDTLDNPTGGILPGEYALLVARLGSGKTLISTYLAYQWAKAGNKVLFVPCEMSIEQSMYRLHGFMGGFNPLIFRTKKPYGSDEELPEKELKEMLGLYQNMVQMELQNIQKAGGDIIFPKQGSYNTRQIAGLIEELKPDITIIDAVYLMGDDNGDVSSDWRVLKGISNSLKRISLENNTRLFCTTQLKRVDKDMGFDVNDIAYADAFGQDGDLVMGLWPVPAKPRRYVMQLLKVRHGSKMGGAEIEIDWRNMTISEVGDLHSDEEDGEK